MQALAISPVRSNISAANVRPLDLGYEQIDDHILESLDRIGICFDGCDIQDMIGGIKALGYNDLSAKELFEATGMDAAVTPPLTEGSITNPVQFFQHWLPGLVRIVTAPREIDDIIGISTQGDWADDVIVQQVVGNSGLAIPYSDSGNIPLANWNQNFEQRTIVRFEMGMTVGVLEQARAAKVRVSSSEEKRYGVTEALEIVRNLIGFSGYDNGANRTFGLLNDTDLPGYNTLPDEGGSTLWANKTFAGITRDIIFMVNGLRTQSEGRIKPEQYPLTLVLAVDVVEQLAVTTDFNISVKKWLSDTYPNITVKTAPQFNGANGGANVGYLFAEYVDMSGTDDSQTFIQVVPAKLKSLGVEQRAKNYAEDYSNATAGVMTKRPYAVFRATGF